DEARDDGDAKLVAVQGVNASASVEPKGIINVVPSVSRAILLGLTRCLQRDQHADREHPGMDGLPIERG
ncbi:hypothetical protein ACCT30_31870, partial [Rhizobium ruizarguesonis]